MGNSQSDTPLIRINLNLQECFVSRCCLPLPKVRKTSQQQQEKDEEDGEEQVAVVIDINRNVEEESEVIGGAVCSKRLRTQSL